LRWSTLARDEALDALRDHADKVLRRMQDAYKQRTFAMHQALAVQVQELIVCWFWKVGPARLSPQAEE
jgi:DNA-binding transcriptional MocR family regulator